MKLRSKGRAFAGLCLAIALSTGNLSAASRREAETPDTFTRIRKIIRTVVKVLTPTTNDDQVTLPKP